MISASPITTSKFGPSGSLKNKNSNLEHARDIIPKISNEVFFDVKYVLIIWLVLLDGLKVLCVSKLNKNTLYSKYFYKINFSDLILI